MVRVRGQGRSDRLLLVSPPAAQSSLLWPLRSAQRGLPARVHRERCHKKEWELLGKTPVVVVVVRSVVSQVSELRRGVVFARVPPQDDSFVLKTPQQHCPYSTSQRSHLLSCEHSWAKQTTGPRTMRLRVRIHQTRHRSKANNKDIRHNNIKLYLTCTSHVSQQYHNASDGITRFHTCTASNP